MSQKISFWAQFQPLLRITIKAMTFLIHYFIFHHWSKLQTNLTTFWEVLAKKLPKSSLKRQFELWHKHFKISNSWTKNPISMKLFWYICHFNTFHLQKLRVWIERPLWWCIQKTTPKCHEINKISTLTSLKNSSWWLFYVKILLR